MKIIRLEGDKQVEVFTTDLGSMPFNRNGDTFIIAYVSASFDLDDLPLPPAERLAALEGVGPEIERLPEALVPQTN